MTELLYIAGDSTYISVNGKEKVKVASAQVRPLGVNSINSVYALETFKGALVRGYKDGEYSIGTLTKKYELKAFAEDLPTYYYDEDMKDGFLFKEDGDLYKATKKNGYKGDKVANDVYSVVVVANNKVYYINDDDELMFYNGKKSVKVADDVDAIYAGHKEGIVYFMTDYSNGEGTLYMSSNGKKPVKIADDVYSVRVYEKFVAYVLKDGSDRTIFASTNGKKFKQLIEY